MPCISLDLCMKSLAPRVLTGILFKLLTTGFSSIFCTATTFNKYAGIVSYRISEPESAQFEHFPRIRNKTKSDATSKARREQQNVIRDAHKGVDFALEINISTRCCFGKWMTNVKTYVRQTAKKAMNELRMATAEGYSQALIYCRVGRWINGLDHVHRAAHHASLSLFASFSGRLWIGLFKLCLRISAAASVICLSNAR